MKLPLALYDDRVRRIMQGVSLFLTVALILANQTNAEIDYETSEWNTLYEKVIDIVCSLYHVFNGVVGPLAALVFVIAGVQWVASRDDPGKRKQAQDAMIVIIVGVLLLQLISPLVKGVFQSVTGYNTNTCI